MRFRPDKMLKPLFTIGVVMSVLATPSTALAAATPGQTIPVAPNDSAATIIANAANVIPAPRQLAWQRLEQYNFLHFGINTFTGAEWGSGRENPNDFQPNGLNTDQWATSIKNAGFKGAVLTVKHHDGFLLFPSKYSNFGVASSSWAGGQGDVAKSFADSMHKNGLKVGFYISPADLHENLSGGKFANGSPSRAVTIPSDPSSIVNGVTFQFNSDDYNTYFENTLYELMSRYGAVDEIWLDGANPTGRNQPYNFSDWIKIVRTLNPTVNVENDGGPDIRWIGNENGYARATEWSVLPATGNAATAADSVLAIPGGNSAGDLGSDSLLSQRKSDGTSAWNVLRWSPGECNGTLSAQHNWFWHSSDTPRPLNELLEIYYNSVGRNCNFLLNLSPNKQGQLDQTTVNAISGFGAAVSQVFGTNLASGATLANDSGTTNGDGRTPDLALDANLDTSWQPTATTGGLVLTLPEQKTFDVISVQEDLNIGQRVRTYAVDSWNGTSWNQIASDTTIGHKKLIRLSSRVTTSQIRLRLTSSRAAPAIAEVGLYARFTSPNTPGKQLVGGQSGRCVDVPNESTTNGTQVQLWDCSGGSGQSWSYDASSKQLQVYGSKCLDANGQGTSNGTAVIIWDCNGQSNQQWNINTNGTITGQQSGLCLDANGAGTANGTQIILWACNGGSNQQWSQRS